MSKKRDRAFDKLEQLGNNVDAKRAKKAVNALVATTRETLALVDVTPEECHEDITALVWQSLRDLRHNQPDVAVMVLTNLVAAAAVKLANKR